MRVGQDLGFGWVLAAYRPGSEEAQADGSVRIVPAHLRAERRTGEAMSNLTAQSESELLAKVAAWAENENRRKDGGELGRPEPTPEPESAPEGTVRA